MHHVGYWILVAIGFGFLIFAHELGHFLAAKAVGVRVLRFALGFGPRLLGKKIGETDYCVCLVPCGGYVKMAGGEGGGDEEATGAPDEFPAKTPGQRALIVLAGPFMSVLVAVPLLFGLFLGGMERPSSRIDGVVPGMSAWKAGLRRGDRITGIREQREDAWKEIRLWREVEANAILGDKVGDVVVRVDRNGTERHFELTTDENNYLGVRAGIAGRSKGYVSLVVDWVAEDSPAEKAGLGPGCRLLEVAGRRVYTWPDVDVAALENPKNEVNITFAAPEGEVRATTVRLGSEPYWGLGVLANRPNRVRLVRPGFPAEKAGIQPGDRIAKLNGQPASNWPELRRLVLDAAPGEVELTVLRDEGQFTASVALEEGETVADVLGIDPDAYPVVEGFLPGSAASAAGIQPGERLTGLRRAGSDRKPEDLAYRDTVHLLAWAGDAPEDGGEAPVLEVIFRRDGEERTAEVALVRGELGLLDAEPRLDMWQTLEPGRPVAALGQAFVETGRWLTVAAVSLWRLVTGRLSAEMLAGPVLILTASRAQAEAGFARFVEFLVIITVHLGLINLVPLPILDGGHIAFLAVEKLRRKPVPEKLMAGLMYAGIGALVLLMIFVTRNDILRILGR